MKVQICPNSIYGVSTCLPPRTINVKKFATKIQNITFDAGLNVNPRTLERSKTGKAKRAKIAANIKITPNNLLGIERKIA
jgi:hypothetical protein